MGVLATYQQTYGSTTGGATYSWSIPVRRVLKTKQSSRFIIKIANCQANSTATVTTPIQLFLSSPELCAGCYGATINTAGNTILTNKLPIITFISNAAQNQNGLNLTTFLTNDFPLNPLEFNVEYSGTQLPPDGNFQFFITFSIFEIDGDIPLELL